MSSVTIGSKRKIAATKCISESADRSARNKAPSPSNFGGRGILVRLNCEREGETKARGDMIVRALALRINAGYSRAGLDRRAT